MTNAARRFGERFIHTPDGKCIERKWEPGLKRISEVTYKKTGKKWDNERESIHNPRKA